MKHDYRARYYNPQLGRFISEDPLGFGSGIDVYAYGGDSPSNFRDPLGLDYSVYQSVIAPLIEVDATITLYGPGATGPLAAQWQQAITSTWNNNPGYKGCSVKFNVNITADPTATDWHNATPAQNYIYVPVGDPTNTGYPGSPHINSNFFTGTIPSGTLPWTVAHEFGHLLDLIDGLHLNPFLNGNDIMNEGDVVSQYDINQILRGTGGRGCGCK